MNFVPDLPMDQIVADSDFNCRGSIAPIDIYGLAKDIEKHGLKQPISVRSKNGKFHLVAGFRRHKAYTFLKRPTIPAMVVEISDAEALIFNLNENLQREDLNIMQEAKAIEKLKLAGFSVTEVAEELNKSTQWVDVRYKLLELPPVIQEAAVGGYINQGQIKELHSLPNMKAQLEAAVSIKEAKIKKEKAPIIKKNAKRNLLKPKIRDKADIEWMQDHIREAIGNNFGTVCLGWAAAYLSDYELFQEIKAIADKTGLPYHIPYELAK